MDHFIPASKKRMLLAIYLDYIILSTLAGFFWVFILNNKIVPFYIEMMILFVVESILIWNIGSPGMKLLGISNKRLPMTDFHGNTRSRRVAFVDERIYHDETFYTIILAAFFLLEGSKKLIRWALWSPPQPFLAIETDALTFPIISMLTGGLLIYAGYLVFKVDIKGLIISFIVILIDIITLVLNWDKWDGYARLDMLSRRQYQNLPVNDRQLEFFQSITPEFLLIITILLLVAIAYSIYAVNKIRPRNEPVGRVVRQGKKKP